MFDSLRGKLTYANVMATVAVFLALGGGAYAALNPPLPRNSIGTRQIKNGAITTLKLAADAVISTKIGPGSITGSDVVASTLGTVPEATHASTSDSANHASSADAATTAQNVATPEAFHEVGAAGEPGFEHSWHNEFGANEKVGFYKDHEGVVHLQGAADGGTTNSEIFRLPPGYRPASGKELAIVAGCDCEASATDPQGGSVTVDEQVGSVVIFGSGFGSSFGVGSDGSVVIATPLAPPGRVWLEGITFRAAS